jgi:hypothetical protein
MSVYSQSWLDSDNALPIILCEVDIKYCAAGNGGVYTDLSLYFSNSKYHTLDGNTFFEAIINNKISYTETLPYEGQPSISFGDVELLNVDGMVDNYLNANTFIWNNGRIRIYYGDVEWSKNSIANIRSDFLTIYDGVIDDLVPKSRHSLAIKFRDKLERLNTAVTDTKIGSYGVWSGTQPNVDKLKPIVIGEPFNISPILINPATLEYLVSQGPIERIIEIRDNGIPVYNSKLTGGAEIDLAAGSFKLKTPSSGAITATVQGLTTNINLSTGATTQSYKNTVVNAIAILLTQYGLASSRLTSAELNLTNLAAIDTSDPRAVGVYLTDRVNILNVCNDLASSIGGRLFVGRYGTASILRFGTPRPDVSNRNITMSDMLANSLFMTRYVELRPAFSVGYSKNWTLQPSLTTSLPEDHKLLMSEEWLKVNTVDSTVAALRKLETEPVQKDTVLIDSTGATAEANRLLNYFKVQRKVIKFTGTRTLLSLVLGQQVTIFHDRFNLNNSGNGTVGQVISLTPKWSEQEVEVEVVI